MKSKKATKTPSQDSTNSFSTNENSPVYARLDFLNHSPASNCQERLFQKALKSSAGKVKMTEGKEKENGSEPIPSTGTGSWTPEEHNKFLEAMKLYGNQWGKVQKFIGTRNCIQIRSHAQKYFKTVRNKALKVLKLTGKEAIFVVTREYRNLNHIIQKKPFEIDLDIDISTRFKTTGKTKALKATDKEDSKQEEVFESSSSESLEKKRPCPEGGFDCPIYPPELAVHEFECQAHHEGYKIVNEPMMYYELPDKLRISVPETLPAAYCADYEENTGEKSPESRGYLSSVRYDEQDQGGLLQVIKALRGIYKVQTQSVF
eukprot:TRINITY_DN353_c0_g1_i1.p2 TRINITY_DN353_c0_g1~~TRINITY_DN353_c0_g1_i1.p2  ORF type:complete len:317 (-),score=21.21 TRINITY_DN353_c0_g1_i1:55-1005(-)